MMTRFEMEIMGKFGEWWQNDAKKRMARMVTEADKDAIVEADGAIKWKCNGCYLPDDCCAMLEHAGYNFSREATGVKRDAEIEAFAREYTKRQKPHTAEELAEMRNAFGPGTVVVDVLSGRMVRV